MITAEEAFYIKSTIIALTIFVVFFYARLKAKERQSLQEEMLEKYREKEIHLIRYCSQNRFNSLWKIFPWQATGVMFIENSKVICVMRSMKGEEFNLTFDSQAISLNWLGKKNYFKNGFWSWFLIQEKDKQYYFTSETGSTIFKSKQLTIDILENIKSSC